jgi:hypothetical protein
MRSTGAASRTGVKKATVQAAKEISVSLALAGGSGTGKDAYAT